MKAGILEWLPLFNAEKAMALQLSFKYENIGTC